jgi:hypothetical protein
MGYSRTSLDGLRLERGPECLPTYLWTQSQGITACLAAISGKVLILITRAAADKLDNKFIKGGVKMVT